MTNREADKLEIARMVRVIKGNPLIAQHELSKKHKFTTSILSAYYITAKRRAPKE